MKQINDFTMKKSKIIDQIKLQDGNKYNKYQQNVKFTWISWKRTAYKS